jgi:hypothetical protein
MTSAQRRLLNLLRIVAEEVKADPTLADRIVLAWEGTEGGRGTQTNTHVVKEGGPTRRGKRRSPAVLDPLIIYRAGEAALRERLAALSIEELKDIVAEHGMDSRKLAMKWKAPDKLVDLIVDTVRERVTKGNVFRHSPTSTRSESEASIEGALSLVQPSGPATDDLASDREQTRESQDPNGVGLGTRDPDPAASESK